jgi:hypothetical protein
MLKDFYNRKKFLIINIIILFNFKKFLKLKHYRVLMLFNIIISFILLKNSFYNYKFRYIYFNFNFFKEVEIN